MEELVLEIPRLIIEWVDDRWGRAAGWIVGIGIFAAPVAALWIAARWFT